MLWCVYWVSVHENKAKHNDVFTLCAIMGSQLVTSFQMLGVLQALSVIWPEPFATLVDFGALMNFRLDVLNVGCVVSASSFHRYVGTTFSFIALVFCMFVFHVLHVLVRQCRNLRRARLRQSTPSLLGPVGTVFMAVFISVSSGIFEPLQCDLHPNGQSTMHAYQQVVCWNSEFGDEHQWMLMVGTLASSVPLAFLSMSLWATTSLPKRLNQGDTVFLNKFAFLFYRFRPSAQLVCAHTAAPEHGVCCDTRDWEHGCRVAGVQRGGVALRGRLFIFVSLGGVPGEPPRHWNPRRLLADYLHGRFADTTSGRETAGEDASRRLFYIHVWLLGRQHVVSPLVPSAAEKAFPVFPMPP